MITAGLIKLSAAALLWIVGKSNGSDVNQTPLLWRDEGQSATMNCSHTKDISYSQMYWYRQLPGEGMKQIVYTTTTPPHKYESGFSEDKFPATKSDPQTGSLTVEKLLPEDSGVYFCAVSQHSDSGLTDGSDVTQTDILWEKQGDNATMSCSHTKGVGYNQMYWYRQLPGETMKLIVLTSLGNEDHDFGEFKGDKFAATKPNFESGTFTVKNLEPEDKGLYFCANMDIITHGLLSFLILMLWINGLTTGDDVNQRDMLWKNEGDNATIHCNHTKGAQYFQMYWYRQLPGETMKLIVFTTTSNTDFGDFNNGKFAATKPDAESGTFTVKNLKPEDKGLYFCAMYWYRQLPGEGMKEIVFTTTIPPHKYESGFSEDKFPATKSDPQTGSLTVEKLLPEDSGVYFCAVSQHSDSGLSDGSDVTQTPLLWRDENQSATMNCSHTKGATFYQMYWYRQLPGEGMKEIVFTTTIPPHKYESGFSEDKFPATKSDPQTGSLTVEKLLPEDSGVYFCAHIKMISALIFTVSLFCAAGRTGSRQVNQTSSLLVQWGQSAQMNCSQDFGGGYLEMYWYQQLPGESMKLIAYTVPYSKPDFGDFSPDKFSATKTEPESGSFTVKNVEPGLTDGSDVTQTDILWEKQGDNATMSCSHTKGASYNQMYWYRQLPGETMKLIVYTTTSNTDFGEFNNGKFAATKPDAESGTFTVKNLEPEDKGLYFCAGDLEDHKFSQLHPLDFDTEANRTDHTYDTPTCSFLDL
ncbi:hypothetical protein ABVT39_026617 [Epinephelus coioides]